MTAATHTTGDDPAVKHHTTVRVMRTRINDLLAENERLRAALQRLTAACESSGVEHSDIVAARAALAGGAP